MNAVLQWFEHSLALPFFVIITMRNIMRNAGLEDAQAGIKIARRNINYLRYACDNTLMAASEEEIMNLLMRAKEKSEKGDLKSTFRKPTSWQLVPSLHGK